MVAALEACFRILRILHKHAGTTDADRHHAYGDKHIIIFIRKLQLATAGMTFRCLQPTTANNKAVWYVRDITVRS